MGDNIFPAEADLHPQLSARAQAYVEQELPRLTYELGLSTDFIADHADVAALDDEAWTQAQAGMSSADADKFSRLRAQLRRDMKGAGVEIQEDLAAANAGQSTGGIGTVAEKGATGRDATDHSAQEADPNARLKELIDRLRKNSSSPTEVSPPAAASQKGLDLEKFKLGPNDVMTPDIAAELLRLKQSRPEAFADLHNSYTGRQRSDLKDAEHAAQYQYSLPRRTAKEFLHDAWADKRVRVAAYAGMITTVAVGALYFVATKDSSHVVAALHAVTPSGTSSGHATSVASQLPTPGSTSTAHNLASAAPTPSSSHSAQNLASAAPKSSHSAAAAATPGHSAGATAPTHAHGTPNTGHSPSVQPIHSAPGVGGDLPSHNVPRVEHIVLNDQTNAQTPWQVLRNAGFSDEDIRKAAKKARDAHAIKQTFLPGGNPNRYFWSTWNGDDSTNSVITSIRSFLPR